MASKSPRKSPVMTVPASPTDHPHDDKLLDRFCSLLAGLMRDCVSRTLPGIVIGSTFSAWWLTPQLGSASRYSAAVGHSFGACLQAPRPRSWGRCTRSDLDPFRRT